MIAHGDLRDILYEAYDVMITDPPYGDHVHKGQATMAGGKANFRDIGFESLTEDLRTDIALLAAGAKRWSLIYTDIEGISAWRAACEAAGAEYIRAIPWVRWSMPQLSGDRPPQGCEMVLLFHPKGKKRWNGPGNLTHLAHKCLRGDGKHPTEKPLDQALDLVSWFSDPGETVLDPCAGSGTVGVACAILGREFLGVEKQEKWARAGNERIMRAERGEFSDRDAERAGRWLGET
jgi:site-specific DNA-methyltransferase (adenine-specific)